MRDVVEAVPAGDEGGVVGEGADVRVDDVEEAGAIETDAGEFGGPDSEEIIVAVAASDEVGGGVGGGEDGVDGGVVEVGEVEADAVALR